jgi:hypothetical protein
MILVLTMLQVIDLENRPLITLLIWLFFAGVNFSEFVMWLSGSREDGGGSGLGGPSIFRTPQGPTVPIPPASKMALDSRELLKVAREEAERLGHDFVGTEHVLLGLLKVGQGAVNALLTRSKVCFENVQQEVECLVAPNKAGPGRRDAPLTPRARKALQIAGKEAVRFQQGLVTPDHVLLGLLLEGSGVGARILKKMGIRAEQIREAIVAGG